jgi:hypothetical protein
MLTEFWWGKPEGKRPLQRPTWKSGHTIKKKRDVTEIERMGVAYVSD